VMLEVVKVITLEDVPQGEHLHATASGPRCSNECVHRAILQRFLEDAIHEWMTLVDVGRE